MVQSTVSIIKQKQNKNQQHTILDFCAWAMIPGLGTGSSSAFGIHTDCFIKGKISWVLNLVFASVLISVVIV